MTSDDDKRREEIAASTVLLTAEVKKLTNRLEESTVRIAELTGRNRALNERSRKHSNWIYATTIGLALSLISSIALAFVSYQFYEQRRVVHCPFYSLVIGSYRPETRPPGPERDKYEEAFYQMRDSYAFLECGPPVPPMPR